MFLAGKGSKSFETAISEVSTKQITYSQSTDIGQYLVGQICDKTCTRTFSVKSTIIVRS